MLNVFRAPRGGSRTRASSRGRLLATTALPVAAALVLVASAGGARAQQVIDGPPPVTKSVNEVIAGGLVVGDTLPASELTIDSAAVIESQGLTLIGSQAGSAGLLTVQDGAVLNINNEFYVGFFGDGELLISSGGQVTNTGSGIGGLGASNSTATVTGAGSTWTSTGTLAVGFQGQGSLFVEAGGALISTNGYVGQLATSTSSATITGAGSSWAASASLFVGFSGHGSLTIADGALVTSVTDSWIGFHVDATGLVTVSGAGSTWTNSAFLTTGYQNEGELRIEAGGTVTNTTGYLGAQTAGIGVATVTGAGSIWTNVGTLFVGQGGQGALTVADGGTVAVTGALGALEVGYLLGSVGVVNVGAAAGSAPVGAGDIDAAFVRFGQGSGSLAFNHSDTGHEFDAAIVGAGQLDFVAGGTVLTGDSSGFAGQSEVGGFLDPASLTVSGLLGGDVTVLEDGTLTGGGAVGGHVDVLGGALANAAGTTLTLGSLDLDAASLVQVTLGAAGSPALFDVTGDLMLDGELTVTDAGGFGPGIYRLFDYGGTLTDNGLDIAGLPAGQDLADWSVQVSVANQINLVGAIAPGDLLFWDGAEVALHDNGAVNGGDGVWDAVNVNWTEMTGAVNGAMAPQPGFAIFSGVAGDVTVDDSAGSVAVTGMQFAVDGYKVSGDPIGLTEAETVVRVGDGTADGAEMTATIASDLTGAGGLAKTDLGTLVLTGTNSYEGGTFVEGGVLVGDVDSLIGDIDNEAGVVFDQGFAGVYDGVWSGDGRFEVEGAGLNLTGDSSGFSGETFVHDGLLFVEGELGGVLVVGDFGRLEGSGSVGTLIIGAGGGVAPGDAIATLTVNGDVTFDTGSVYEVQTDPVSGASDLIHATGSAEINGGTVAHVGVDGDYAAFSTYTILTADGGVDGTFDELTTDFAFLDPVLTYDANNVFLTLVRNDITFAGVGQTPNQIAAGGGVESLAYGDPVWNAVVMLKVDEARDAFDGLSGEVHPSMRGALIEDGARLRQALVGHLHRDRIAEGVNLWAEAYGATARIDGDGNASGLDRDGRGLFVGADAVFGPWRLGVAAGASDMAVDLDRGSSADSESRHLAAYGDARWGALALRFGAARSWHAVVTERIVAFPGFSEAASADYDAESTQAFVEAGWRMDAGTASLEPFANLAHLTLDADSFMEDGGAAALAGDGEAESATFTTLGLRAAQRFAPNAGGAATLHGSLGWRHAAGDLAPEGRHRFDGAGDAFTVYGVPIAADALVVEAGLDVALSDRIVIGAAYSGQLGDGVRDHALRGRASWRF